MVVEARGQHDSRWVAIAIAAKIGCTAETLRRWVRQHERENRELRKAHEILKLTDAFFAQAELDRRLK